MRDKSSGSRGKNPAIKRRKKTRNWAVVLQTKTRVQYFRTRKKQTNRAKKSRGRKKEFGVTKSAGEHRTRKAGGMLKCLVQKMYKIT